MRLTSKSVVITAAGVVLLGTSLALLSAGVVSGSSAPAAERQIQRESSCISGSYCLTVSNTGNGGAIKGTSKKSSAIFGVGNGFDSIGVKGQSIGSGGTGLEGVSIAISDGVGVYGEGAGTAVAAYNPRCCNTFSYGLTSQVDDYSSFPIYTFGAAEGTAIPAGSFSVDAAGDGVFDGFVQADGGYFTAIPGRGGRVRASVPLAPRATIEDTGTARLTDGVGVVHLDPTFAGTLDTSKVYQVFVTPDGETRGWLYVAQKYQAGFVVREAEHGRSSVYFDYRVVAHVAGTPDEKFPAYHQRRAPRPNLRAYLQQQHQPSGD